MSRISHLTESQVTEICHRYASGEKQYRIAEAFGMSQSCISKIIARTAGTKRCFDCGTSISFNRKRCDACRATWNKQYFRQWYNRNRKVSTTRRYHTKQGRFVVDKETSKVYGPYTYNHARYLTAKWNKREVSA